MAAEGVTAGRDGTSIMLYAQNIVLEQNCIDFATRKRNGCTSRHDGLTPARPGTIASRLAIPEHDTAPWTPAAGGTAPAATVPEMPLAPRHLWES